jgi:hypothetical protein
LAIAKVPTYQVAKNTTGFGGGTTAINPTAAKKVVAPPVIGYTGSGWNYPSSSVGNQVVHYPTTPGASPSIVAPSTSYASVPVSAAPSGGNVPGGSSLPSPDIDPSAYLGELTSDPLYQSGLSNYQNTLASNQNMLSNSVRQALIQGGWGGGQVNLGNVGGQDLSGLVDQSTLDAANANQMSDRAQLQTQLNRGQADIGSQLAARGAARSGAANIMAANNQNQYDVASNTAMQNLAAALSGNVQNWATNNNNALAGWNTTQANVANRLSQIAAAQAQAAYANALNNQGQQVGLDNGGTITSAPTGPAPATVKAVQAVKQVLTQRATNPYKYQVARNVRAG